MTATAHVNVECPMGCGDSLTVDDDGLHCTAPECWDPYRLADLFDDPTAFHLLDTFDDLTWFVVRHAAGEDDETGCPLESHLMDLADPPVEPGSWRVAPYPGSLNDEWVFVPVEEGS